MTGVHCGTMRPDITHLKCCPLAQTLPELELYRLAKHWIELSKKQAAVVEPTKPKIVYPPCLTCGEGRQDDGSCKCAFEADPLPGVRIIKLTKQRWYHRLIFRFFRRTRVSLKNLTKLAPRTTA